MEVGIEKLLVEYLCKTKRLKTLEVLRDELVKEKRTKLSFTIQSAPKRTQVEIFRKKSSLTSKKDNALDKKRMNYTV